jgi:hypothetical protein
MDSGLLTAHADFPVRSLASALFLIPCNLDS